MRQIATLQRKLEAFLRVLMWSSICVRLSIALLICGSIAHTTSDAAETLDNFHPPYTFDLSDLWWNPDEPGWGMQVKQTGSFAFVTLYLHDANKAPTWFTAELSLEGTALDGNIVWSGPLYATEGPWWGNASFSSAEVRTRTAGTMTLRFRGADATLTYSVDGVRQSKRVVRQSLTNPVFAECYRAYRDLLISYTDFPAQPEYALTDVVEIYPTLIGSTMTWRWVTARADCITIAPAQLSGSIVSFDSSYVCSDGTSGGIRISGLRTTPNSLSGYWTMGNVVGGYWLIRGWFAAVVPMTSSAP